MKEACQPSSRKIDVLLLGFLDNPVVKCVKQLFNNSIKSELMPLPPLAASQLATRVTLSIVCCSTLIGACCARSPGALFGLSVDRGKGSRRELAHRSKRVPRR